MHGLAPHTAKIFDAFSKLECIKPYTLVGGTALSIQLNHRKSEDLDFMRWPAKKGDKVEVNWPEINKELRVIDPNVKPDILDFNHVNFLVQDVKVSFYAAPRKSPVNQTIPFLNNVVLADINSIASMKMEVLLRRAKYRDYYDLYCILKDKNADEIKEIIKKALSHAEYKLSGKSLLSMLTNSSHFSFDKGFEVLEPQIVVSAMEIEQFMKEIVKTAYLAE